MASWLKTKLEDCGFEIIVPRFPIPKGNQPLEREDGYGKVFY